jgi:hypothetical protein
MQDGKRFKQGRHISWGRTLQKPDVKFANAEGKQGMFGNLWGVSTRLMGHW